MAAQLGYETMLSPEMLEKARKMFGEDDEKRAQTITIIREWMKQQPHFVPQTGK